MTMIRTYELVVEISDHPTGLPYLVTLRDAGGVAMAHRASSLEVCLAAVTGRLFCVCCEKNALEWRSGNNHETYPAAPRNYRSSLA